MRLFRQLGPAFTVSVFLHVVLFVALGLWKIVLNEPSRKFLVETVMEDANETEVITQEMNIDTSTSQSLTATGGGTVTGAIGASSASPMATSNLLESKALDKPKVNITKFSEITMPGTGSLAVDLGEGQVAGETGAKVEGYGAAMHRMTNEIRRMMREQQVLVVWLFDASNSLKDDRQELRENFHKIYEELDLVRAQAEGGKGSKERYHHLETVIASFGSKIEYLTKKPTADLKEIKDAIDKVGEDASGQEAVFNSIGEVIDRFGKQAKSSDRRLAVVVMTDEIGDDTSKLEDVVQISKQFQAPVYFLGREAIFGYPYARMRWTNPETKVDYWVNVDRGPETAMPEALQWNGFHGRWDSASSGFANYPQARLVRESGGIYFMLQTEEQALIGSAAHLQRKFDDIRMRQYEPGLEPAREYVKERDASDFRRGIWAIISTLNPHTDEELNIAYHHPIDIAEFKEFARPQFKRAVRALVMSKTAIEGMEKLRPLRDKEPSARWRAAYDLTYAQLLAYRVRLFQYMLAADNHADQAPLPKNPKSNRWNRNYAAELIEPTEAQIKAAGIDLAELEAARTKALEMYDVIIQEHPETPWAQRAQQEKSWGFGIRFDDEFYDPKYFDPKELAKVPKF